MGTSKDELVDDSETELYDAASKESDTEAEAEDDDSAPPPLKESCPYLEGEKVLAFHSLQVYEARVRKIEYRLKERRYFLHYLGWNKNWDEWVLRSRLMKYTDENIQKYVTNNSKHDLEKNARPGRPALLKAVPRGRKRKIDTSMKGALSSGNLVTIRLPAVVKKQLIDDCEFITHLGKYEQVIMDNVLPSMVYGAEHLLRLFVKLPELLLHANIEEETLTELHQKLTEFLKFLQKNRSTFFMSTYNSSEDSETSKNCPVG